MTKLLNNEIAEKLGSKPKSALVSTFLVAIAFVWYLCSFKFLQDAAVLTRFGADSLLIVVAFSFLSLILSAIFGSAVIRQIQATIDFP